jgi:hypothetical protein
MVKGILAMTVLAGIAGAVAVQYPELRRYMKIRSM